MADVGIAEIPRGGGGPGAKSGLAILSQPDFRSGMWRGFARNLMPGDAVYDLQNLLFSDEWSLFKRGGTAFKSNQRFAAGRFLWDGVLAGGARTLFASASAFGTLDVDDATPINLGGSGIAAPVQASGLAGVLFVGNGPIYAGSRRTAGYSTGTVAIDFTTGIVTGSGTSWTANADAGMLLTFNGGNRYYPVKSVGGNTALTLTLASPAPATTLVGQITLPTGTITVASTAGFPAAGNISVGGQTVAYTGITATTFTGCTGGTGVIADGAVVTALQGTAGLTYALVPLGTTALSGSQYRTSEFQTVAGRRLISVEGDTIAFSNRDNPHRFDVNDQHKLPAGPTGIGAAGIGDTALIFTTQGLYTLTGLINPIVDATGNPLHRLQLFSSDLVLWGNSGIAQTGGQVVAPCVDDIYLLDGRSAPERLSISISKLYRDYVAAGYHPGGAAVTRSHYVLPILDQSGNSVDTLICRLDRPAWRGRHIPLTWPWSRLSGHAGRQAAFSQRVRDTNRAPDLLGVDQAVEAVFKDELWADASALSAYTQDAGAGTLSVSGNQLVPADAAEKRLRYTAPWKATDQEVTWRFVTGASVAGETDVSVIAKALDADDYLMGLVAVAGGGSFLRIYKQESGSFTAVSAATAGFAMAANTTYWIRLRVQGNVATVELFTGGSLPAPGAAPVQSMSGTLAGADATKYGAGVSGQFGARAVAQATDWRFGELKAAVPLGRVNSFAGLFAPSAANKYDADGVPPACQIITRDFEPMGGNICHMVKARLRYELVDAAADDPFILAAVSDGTFQLAQTTYGSALGGTTGVYGASFYNSSDLAEFTPLAGEAPEDDGRHPYPWQLQRAGSGAIRGRFVRLRFLMDDPAASLVLRQLDVFYRPAGRPR